MGLLRKLFCKEEPQPAPEPEPPTETDTRPEYVARSHVHYEQQLTCVWCGKTASVRTYEKERGGWKAFYGPGLPRGGVEACPDCRGTVSDWQRSVEHHNANRETLQRKNRFSAYAEQRRWDAANPPPSANIRNSSFVFVRRTTCGSCGKVEEIEGPQHKLPSWPDGWARILDDRGTHVCPDCYAKFEPLREATKQWRADRDDWVGGFFRAADRGLPEVRKLCLPDRWRK